jgi:hypothetical protein
MKKDIKFYILNTIWNVAELVGIIIIGLLNKIPLENVLLLLVMFALCRWTFSKPKHYKEWWKCLIWSIFIFTTLYFLARINIIYAVLFTILNVRVLSGKSDINDILMWNGCKSKYDDVTEFIKYNSLDDNLISFEEKISKQNNLTFMIYKYRFRDNLTFQEISDKLDIETPRITDELEKIAFAIRIYCKI